MARAISRIANSVEAVKYKRIALFTASLLICVVFRVLVPDSRKTHVNTDYEQQVGNLVAGRGFLSPDGTPLYRYPPLFPVLLAGIYKTADILSVDRRPVVFVVSALLIAVASVVAFAIARLFFAESTAFLSAIVFASHPLILYGALIPLSETPFMVFLLSALFFLLRAVSGGTRMDQCCYAGMCGLLVALAMLTRPIALFLPLVFVAAIALWGRSKRPEKAIVSTLFLLVVLLVLSPWEGFIYSRTHELVTLSSGGMPGMLDGFSFNNKASRDRLDLPTPVEELSNEFWTLHETFKSPRDIGSFLLENVRQKPMAVLEFLAVKVARAWFGTESQNHRLELINKWLLLIYMPGVLLGLFWYWQDRPADRVVAKITLVLACYFWLMTVLVLSIARYMVPAVGLLLVFAAYPIERYTQRIRSNIEGGCQSTDL